MFLAIELVQGVSLSRLIKEAQTNQEAFAERTVAYICSQICGGLVAAHTLTAPDGSPLGIVHRDLTPANILISFDGQVKIIDFGIAKAEERISHTRTGQLKGKPAYMAPEQQRGGAMDARADLFAFGVVMFEMLAGRRPWTSKGAFDVMMEISNDPHPDLGELRKGLNPEFVGIAHRCLEKKPEDRIQTAAEIKARLDAWLAAKGFSADDQHSLAQFVLRNSQPQVLWWQEALRGEHAKKKAPTFKELEEKIDEEREKKAKAQKRAAAAAAAPRPAAGTMAMPAYAQAGGAPPDSGGVPSSAPTSPHRSASGMSMMGVGPSSLTADAAPRSQPHPQAPAAFGSGQYQAPRHQGSGQHQAVGPQSYPQPGTAGSGQYQAVAQPPSTPSPASQSKLAQAGTEFMAMSPFAAMEAQRPAPNPAVQLPTPHAPVAVTLQDTPLDPDGGTIPMGPGLKIASVTQPLPPGVPVGARSTGMNLGPPNAHSTGTNLGSQVAQALNQPPPSSSPSPVLGGMPGSFAAPQTPARRSRLGLVLFLLVLLLGGAGAGLYFFGDRVGINVGRLLK